MNRETMKIKVKRAIRASIDEMQRTLLSIFAVVLLGVSGCMGLVSSGDARNVSFGQADANHFVSEVVHSLLASHVFSTADGRRNVVVVDALDVTSAVCREDIVAVGRTFDVSLRTELMNSGCFFVYEADNRSSSAPKIVPQYRFTGKLSRLTVDEGGAKLTLSAAVADVSTGQVVWSKKASVGKLSR